jgi:putative transposase
MKEREKLISNQDKLSIRTQCKLLSVNRGNIYYKPEAESAENLAIMQKIDRHNLEHPTDGVLRTQDFLKSTGIIVNSKRLRRLLRKMGIMAIYPKKNLSKLGESKYIRPYLLKNMHIERSNQVWEIDITYIPMKNGFLYLIAIIDVYSRYIVGWNLTNSLAAENCLNLLKQCILTNGKPEIINSDQGIQFTCISWIEFLEKEDIKISMDGKGRAIDNIYIERFWRTIKVDYIYLHPLLDGLDLYKGINQYIDYYNNKQSHQGIGRKTPISLYKNTA